MSKVEEGGGVRLTPPPSRLLVTIFSSRLLGLMFYLTSKFHDDSVNTFGFMEVVGGGGGAFEVPSQAQEIHKSAGGIGLRKCSPNLIICCFLPFY